MACVGGFTTRPLLSGRMMVDPCGKTSLASNMTIAAAARTYLSRSLIFPASLSFNAEAAVQVP